MKRLLIIAVCLAMAPGALANEKAGVSAAVRGQVSLANDDHPLGNQLASGQPIYQADRISSGAASGLQIMLLDQSALTIGPDSTVAIDEFVYDPATKAGKLTASLGKGVFRLVRGKVARQGPSDTVVKLSAATIHVHGNMIYGRSDQNSAIVGLAGAGLNNTAGGIEVITPDGAASVNRPGWGVFIERGKPPVVQKLSAPTVDAILLSLAPRELADAHTLPAGVAAAAPNLATFNLGRNLQQDSSQSRLGYAGNGGGDAGCVASPGCPGFSSGIDALTTYARLANVVAGIGAPAVSGGGAQSSSKGGGNSGSGNSGGVTVDSFNFSLTINFGNPNGHSFTFGNPSGQALVVGGGGAAFGR
jgi:hypothetical protein